MDKEKRITADIRNHTCRLKSPLLSNILAGTFATRPIGNIKTRNRYTTPLYIVTGLSAKLLKVMKKPILHDESWSQKTVLNRIKRTQYIINDPVKRKNTNISICVI